MFDIQGTTTVEKDEMQNLVDILHKTKTGKILINRLAHLSNRAPIVLKFDPNLPVKGYCEFKQITLNPRSLEAQSERVSTLGHELAHAMMFDIQKSALNNTSSLDEYALVKLLWETHAHMVGDSILQELKSPSKEGKKGDAWYEKIDLAKKEDRTLYLKKALMLETGWAQYELKHLNKSRRFSPTPNADTFKENCAHFLTQMDTDVALADVLKVKPYSHYIQMSSNLWKMYKKFFSR